MRVILILLFFKTLTSFGQAKDNSCIAKLDTLTGRDIYTVAEKMPAPEGGMSHLSKEILRKIRYPSSLRDHSIESKIYVAFVVGDDGKISGKRTLLNIRGTNMADQVLEVVDDVKWYPGTCGGKNVPVLVRLPFIVDVK